MKTAHQSCISASHIACIPPRYPRFWIRHALLSDGFPPSKTSLRNPSKNIPRNSLSLKNTLQNSLPLKNMLQNSLPLKNIPRNSLPLKNTRTPENPWKCARQPLTTREFVPATRANHKNYVESASLHSAKPAGMRVSEPCSISRMITPKIARDPIEIERDALQLAREHTAVQLSMQTVCVWP